MESSFSYRPRARLGIAHRVSTLCLSVVCSCLFLASQARAVVDLNANGMSDIWELVFDAAGLAPNDDADGDEQNNLAESLAGTNPFDASSRFALSQFTRSPGNVTLAWPSIVGKQYQAQSCPDLAAANWTDEGNPLSGTGSEIVTNYPTSQAQQFWRVMVHDVDTDGDGVADWEELQVGFNPTSADSNNDGTDDLTALQNALTATNIVTVTAPDFSASETGADPVTFVIDRAGNLNAITVGYTMSGSASNGVDYVALPGSVTLPIGVNSATITLTPLSDALVEPGELVTLSVNPSAAYQVGNPGQANAIISDSTEATGTGLLGRYFDNSSPIYTNSTNFTGLMLTRVDPTVNFDWLATAPIPAMGTNFFSIIWTGQVQPEHSETYTFVARTDDGVKLWVNGTLIIDAWTNAGQVERTGTINLAAGVRHDIRMEYFEAGGNAMAMLSWYSPSQAKQIIPQNRLYPSNAAPTAVTSPLTALGLVGCPFTYTVTGSNLATNRDASGLPPGLTFTPGSGVISGVPTTAGKFQVLLRVTNALGTSYSILELTILEATGLVFREFWNGVGGASVTMFGP